jgi:S-layer homology domain
MAMRFWMRVLAESLAVLGLAAIGYAQVESRVARLKGMPGVNAAMRSVHAGQPDTYGTSAVSYYNIDAADLIPVGSDVTYTNEGGTATFSTNNTGFAFQAGLHLPSGALLVSIELDYWDFSTTGEVIASLWECNYDGLGCSVPLSSCGGDITICSGVGEAPGVSYTVADISGAGIQVNNQYNRYFVLAGNTTTDANTQISRISVGYKLQVSPATGPPTFNDVQPSNPQFQFVEALVAAGITAGCGGGNYCPNNPVTRGQIAVFLAKALGLQWP